MVRKKEDEPLSEPSLALIVMVEVPRVFGAGVREIVRFAPLPKVMALAGRGRGSGKLRLGRGRPRRCRDR